LSRPEGWELVCIGCGTAAETELPDSTCRKCGDLLEIKFSRARDGRSLFDGRGPGIWRFRRALPFTPDVEPVSLEEGGTPLVRTGRFSTGVGLQNLFAKNDGQNPTGSFKDRGMSVAVTRAKTLGAKALVCASTGNTAASLAAYAAKAGMDAVVVVPRAGVALGKLGQAFAYGARVFGIEGNFDQALATVFDLVRKDDRFYLVNSVNPFRIEGQKIAAFEIYEQLSRVPDYLVLPVGNAGNISAIWKGFKELRELGIVDTLPKMIGVQAAGAAPLAAAVASGEPFSPLKEPRTVASAIRIGNPVSWKKALNAIGESGGDAVVVSDDEIMDAKKKLAQEEGLLVEAASAAPFAALIKLKMPREAAVVCIATGNGLKDLSDHGHEQKIEIAEDSDSIANSIGSGPSMSPHRDKAAL
jgi:threonine synthase